MTDDEMSMAVFTPTIMSLNTVSNKPQVVEREQIESEEPDSNASHANPSPAER